jgi:hypothetical protein
MAEADRHDGMVRDFIRFLRLRPPSSNPNELFEFKKLGLIPEWLQAVAVVALFVASVLLACAMQSAPHSRNQPAPHSLLGVGVWRQATRAATPNVG